jgi:hypothetical protein
VEVGAREERGAGKTAWSGGSVSALKLAASRKSTKKDGGGREPHSRIEIHMREYGREVLAQRRKGKRFCLWRLTARRLVRL